MPELTAEVRRGIDKATAEAKAAQTPEDGSPSGDDAGGEPAEEDEVQVDVNGGLAGLEVFVELSLNGQNFTEDRVHFTYHGAFEPANIRMIAPPEGVVVEQADPKAAPKKGKGEESTEQLLVYPGSKLACEVR